jgi:hypothetical protein
MGYRSDAVLKIRKEHYEGLLEGAPDKEFLAPERDDGYIVTIVWNNVKWYDDSPEIAHITAFMDALPDDDYGFMRIGEAYDDVEDLGIPWDFGISLQRSLEY